MAKVDKSGYKRISVWSAKRFLARTVGGDGVEVMAVGLPIPPYCNPTNYWLTGKLVGATGKGFNDSMFYTMRGGIVPLPLTQTIDESSSPVTGDIFLARYFPASHGQVFEADDTAEVDLGLTGGETVLDWAKRHTFFTREKQFGLPDAAIVSADNQIAYVDAFSTKGKINSKAPVAISDPKFIMFGITCDELAGQTAWDEFLFGATTPDSIADWAENIFEDLAPSDVQLPGVGWGSEPTELHSYLSNTFVDTLLQVGGSVDVQFKLTVRMDVYAPISGFYHTGA